VALAAAQAPRRALALAERAATRPAGAVALFAIALVVYALQALAWPLVSGRDLDEYVLFYLQAFDRDTLLPWSMLFRTPGTPLVVGPVLDLWGGALAEPVAALLYAASILCWTATALAWGRRAAIATAAALLLYPGYALMFHELGSELVMAFAFSLVALLVVRASTRPSTGRWAAAGLAAAFLVLVRPGNVVVLALALLALVAGASWRTRLGWAGAFAAAALLPLGLWVVHNGLRYDEWGLARGGKAVIPFYRALLFDRIVGQDDGPASRRLAAAVRDDLVTREPYRSYGVTVDDVFERASARVHEDMYTLSDEVFGWDTDYGVLRSAALEGVRAHPGAYASGVLDTVWQQLSEPYYRNPAEAPPAPSVAAEGTGLPPPSEGQLIPGGQNLWILRPDNAIRQVWTSPTAWRFVFDHPADRPRFDELVGRRDELLAALPDRDGNGTLVTRANQLSRWYPRSALWLVVGLIAVAIRRPRNAAPLVALTAAALLVVGLNALGLGPDPHYVLPVAPAFVLLALAALLAPRRGPPEEAPAPA
jgi:hypothetical protein